MALTGSLTTMSLPDLLQWVTHAQKSGLLTLWSGGSEKRVYLRSGRLAATASNDPREYLGQFLMSHGYVSEEELEKAMAVQQESGMLLGKILVTIGAMGEEDLVRLMRTKAEESIYEVFLWEEGEFRFDDDEQPSMQMVPLQIDPTAILMEGMRRVDEWRRIREMIPSTSLIPHVAAEEIPRELGDAERRVVEAINGRRSIAEIILESRSSEFIVSRTVADLLRRGVAELESPPKSIAAERKPEAQKLDAAALLRKAQLELRKRDFAAALSSLRAAQALAPGNHRVEGALASAEGAIVAELRSQGIDSSAVPLLLKPLEELTTLSFTPPEAFLLSRINGVWTIGSIIKVSPMRESDAMLIFHRLRSSGVIEFAA
jgi:hypothetical protein